MGAERRMQRPRIIWINRVEDTVRLAAALRPALGSRGVPDGIYVDYGGVSHFLMP